MLTDAFHKRYPNRFFWDDGFPNEVRRLLIQAGQIIAQDLFSQISVKDKLYQDAHDKLSREYGIGLLGEGNTYEEVCLKLIFENYDLWNNYHRDQDYFFKMRIGLIELLFRNAEEYLRKEHNSSDLGMIASILSKRTEPKRKSSSEKALESFLESAKELNLRFREAKMPFTYHNGYIQLVEDELTQKEVEEPFWSLVSDKKWENVDYEMKEAIDRRDVGKEDAITYALKALESTIKIISDDNNWTSGREKGASNYIDNLVSEKNGRFVALWEAEAMKHLFAALRNPRSHGSGSAPRPEAHDQQRAWAIESCMSWIKSLIKRK
jgi:hypothetical protein